MYQLKSLPKSQDIGHNATQSTFTHLLAIHTGVEAVGNQLTANKIC